MWLTVLLSAPWETERVERLPAALQGVTEASQDPFFSWITKASLATRATDLRSLVWGLRWVSLRSAGWPRTHSDPLEGWDHSVHHHAQ